MHSNQHTPAPLHPLSPALKLPYITPGLPGTGGEIKAQSEHFIVEEVPLYEPCGKGEHVYVRCTREGWTTRGLQKRLADLFGLREWSVGYAGLKDKHARVTQTFSLHLPKPGKQEIPISKAQIPKESQVASQRVDCSATGLDLLNVQQKISDHLPVEIHWIKRHRNKLRTGHLQGNRFRILVLNSQENAFDRAQAIAAALTERGLPNFYGAQRFGIDGDNALQGLEVLQGRGPRQRWKRRFLIDALRSALFNAWLVERIEQGWFETLLPGDIARKCDSGGLFEVEDL
ncbi:MAG: tRNA pseudouridine(13) synthase TruD, partial [bacterium]